MLINKEKSLVIAASKAGMSEKTARKYLRLGKMPSEVKKEHTWQTREDPFAAVWDELLCYLRANPGLEAQTLFNHVQRKYPGQFQDGQLRSLQRKIKRWRALEGPGKLDQALMLRGSRDFSSRQEYEKFIEKLFSQRNMSRRKRFLEELKQLKRLPAMRLDDFKRMKARVGRGSTISIYRHVYSVPSRLIGEEVEVRLSAEMIEVWYGQKMIDRFARLHGQKGYRINYRHIIDWLIRKPGAFENYRYRDELFPSTRFRMAYDSLKEQSVSRTVPEYLGILSLAAKELEAQVKAVDLSSYDVLLSAAFH